MAQKGLLGLLLIFLVGFSIGFVELAFRLVLGYDLPKWSLMQYLGAVFLLGSGYLVAEILWHPIGRVLVDADKVSDPLWNRGLRVLILIVLGMLPIVVYILWQLKASG